LFASPLLPRRTKRTLDYFKAQDLRENDNPSVSINQSFILPEKFVAIKASKTKHMRTGQQGKTLTAAL